MISDDIGVDFWNKLNYHISNLTDWNAMKRKVENKKNHRESQRVRRDMEVIFEHGLGVAHRLQ